MHENFAVPTNDLHPHQKEYYDALCKMKEKKKNFHSIVCIPTGGGKIRLAITYAINEELNKGKRILWIAHSHYLLDQAYDAFYLLSGKKFSEDYNNMLLSYYLEVSYLSIDYQNKRARHVKKFEYASYKRYDVIVASFQGILNYVKSRGEEKNPLEKLLGNNVCIIVDEVHHLGAPVYYKLLEAYVEDKTLIGLSATPERTDEAGNYWLGQMFPDDLGVTVNMVDLIAKKQLMRPTFEDVRLPRDKYGDFVWKEEYDKEVYNRYIKNQDRYGKTVIFANDIRHAEKLYELFKKDDSLSGRVYLIHSYLKDRFEQFFDFKDSKDGILINVNIMNEGVDIPDIKTVFFTKPIGSRIIVTQCIGRALRTCEGKDNAYVVNFAVVGIGDKLYLTSPKMAYEMDEADFFEGNRGAVRRSAFATGQQIFKDLKTGIGGDDSHISFSVDEVCLAGYYSLETKSNSLLLPVTYNEHEKIAEHMKYPDAHRLPARYFFNQQDNVEEIIRGAAKDRTYEFISYDDTLNGSFQKLQESVNEIYQRYFHTYHDKTFPELNKELHSLFLEVKNDTALWEYFKQLNVTTERKLVLLIWNRFVDLKEYWMDVTYEHVSWINNFANEDWININEINSIKQYLGVEKWLKAYPNGFLQYAHGTVGTIRRALENGWFGSTRTKEKIYWKSILGEYIDKVYEEIIKEVVPTLECCKNSYMRKQIIEGLYEVKNQIVSRIGWSVNDQDADIGKILYSQLVEKQYIISTVSEWLDRVYDFSSISQEAKKQIQSIVDDIFDKEIIIGICYEYNAKILAKKIREFCTNNKRLVSRELVIQGYYCGLDKETNNRKERRKIFEKKVNKYWIVDYN